jgi:hypothetical protein
MISAWPWLTDVIGQVRYVLLVWVEALLCKRQRARPPTEYRQVGVPAAVLGVELGPWFRALLYSEEFVDGGDLQCAPLNGLYK